MSTARVGWRTRRARRDGDAGGVLRAVARGTRRAVGLRLRGRRVLLVLDPDLAGELLAGHAANTVKGPGLQRASSMLGDGLLTGEGAAHDRARRLLAGAFSPRRLAGYTTIFVQCATESTAEWGIVRQRDIHADMGALTLRIAGLTLLGTDLSAQAPLVRAGLAAGELGVLGGAALGARRRRGAANPGAANAATGAALHRIVDDIIVNRHAEPDGDRGDVLSVLFAASTPPDGLTDKEIHDHVITLLLAGHETTASALTWAVYLLGRHPQAQEQLQAEADSLGGRPPAYGDLAALPYARAVVSEALRLYPPAWIIGRELTVDVSLGGWRLPAGSVAAVSPLLLHHDPRWYPDPARFDPARWLDTPRDALPKYAFLPFGTGPRACIGEQFAWAEAITVLTTLAQSWSFRTIDGVEPGRHYGITLRPADPVLVTAQPRASR